MTPLRVSLPLWTTLWVGVGLSLAGVSATPIHAFGPTPVKGEYQAKGEVLGKLAEYTGWPSRTGVADGGRPLVIGILGDSPHLQELARFSVAKTVKGKLPRLQFLKTLSGVDGCDLIFICESEGYRLSEVLRAVRGKPILTVGDTPGFATRGVMINLVIDRDQLALEVNLLIARQAGLEIGSPILKRARLIE